MALPSTVLTWTAMSATVNRIKQPGRFVRNLLFSVEETLPTETLEIGTVRGARDIAPFVRVGGEGVMVGGTTGEFYTITGTNIRIKRPFRPSELLYTRRPGSVIMPDAGQISSAVEQYVARDLEYMNNLTVNAEEYLCAMALRGAISYSVTDTEVFTITYARSGSHAVTPSVYWTSPSTATAIADVRALKALVAEDVGLNITDALCGSEAATAFLNLPQVLSTINIQSGIVAGSLDLTQQYRNDGAIFLGRWMGINWWEYPRALNLNGSSTALIRAKYIEFVCATPEAMNSMNYCSIPDMKTLQGRTFQAKKFSKSWEEEDPSAVMALIHTRPFPCMKVPDSTVSFKACTG
jgi:hypothetical protein